MVLRYSVFFCFFIITASVYGQYDLRRVNVSTLPEEVRLIKDISLAIRWTDTTGDHVVVTTEKLKRPSDDVVLRRSERGLFEKGVSDYFKESAIPYAYFFTIKNDSTDLRWTAVGNIKSCSPSTKGDNIKTVLVVTDLNEDKVAEVWMIYKAICVDNEAIGNMEITMYHGDKKYVLNGIRDQRINGETIKGHYTFDEAFKNTLPVFIKYAEQLWKKHQID